MAEFIDRQKVLDLTKTFALDIDWVEDPMYLEFSYVATNAIKNIPAADVRPVVMCKDCMHWEYDAIFADGWCRGRQQGNPNWYCADGKKREES